MRQSSDNNRFAYQFDRLYRGHEIPYMHIVVYHSLELIEEHGCLADYSQEGNKQLTNK